MVICQYRLKQQVKDIESVIDKFTARPYSIEFSPNLLQLPGMAYFVTQFVTQDDKTIVISTYPSDIAILHEFVHPFISSYRDKFAEFLPKIDINKYIDTNSMVTYGYMWDDSEGSKIHALEECFVRGISIGISNMNEQEKVQYCRWSCDSGFLFATEIINAMKSMEITEDSLGEFIQRILEL